MTITETTTGETITMHLELDIFGQYHGAELDGRARYAIIDGLLWWAIRRMHEAFTYQVGLQGFTFRHDGEIVTECELLLHSLDSFDFANSPQPKAQRALHKTLDILDRIAPLAITPGMKDLLQQLQSTARILQERLQHRGEALRGVEGILKHQDAA